MTARRILTTGTILASLAAAATDPELPRTARGTLAPLLVVRVVEDASRQPLPNAEVIDLDSGAHRFTNAAGEARVPWPDGGRIRLRVRELGFQFTDRELARSAPDGSVLDTVTIALTRVAYILPNVTTSATSQCASDADSATKAMAVVALGQLRMGAERYEAFRKAYPFRIRQKRRTIRFLPTGVAREVRETEEQESSDNWGEPYKPGHVLERSAMGFSIPLLFLTSLANPVFWEHHCFAVRGAQSLHDDRVIRLEFAPAHNVTAVDWVGVAFVDSATSVLRRVEFQLAGLRDDDVPWRLEGYTTFRSPSPLIVIPDSTVAMWWRRDRTIPNAWTGPDVVQLLRLLDVSYKKAKPAGVR